MKDTLFSNSENKLKRLYILTPVTDCADMWEEKKSVTKSDFCYEHKYGPMKKILGSIIDY